MSTCTNRCARVLSLRTRKHPCTYIRVHSSANTCTPVSTSIKGTQRMPGNTQVRTSTLLYGSVHSDIGTFANRYTSVNIGTKANTTIRTLIRRNARLQIGTHAEAEVRTCEPRYARAHTVTHAYLPLHTRPHRNERVYTGTNVYTGIRTRIPRYPRVHTVTHASTPIRKREAVFSPNPMRLRPCPSCDFDPRKSTKYSR